MKSEKHHAKSSQGAASEGTVFCLPSGKPLAQFVLSSGFLAHKLWAEAARKDRRESGDRTAKGARK